MVKMTLMAVANSAGMQAASGIEGAMLSNDKLFVVLAVVLVIWVGIAFFIFSTDRKLDRLEAALNDREAHTAGAEKPQ